MKLKMAYRFLVMKKAYVILLFLMLFTPSSHALQRDILRADGVNIVFDKPLSSIARHVAEIFPVIKSELEVAIGWEVGFKPTVVLVKSSSTFHRMAGSNLIVAYAVPKSNLIVIDHSKMNTHPFTLKITLKHEMAHLILHHHISRILFPKWLDEGVCQWLSDGFSEIVMNPKRTYLHSAALSKRLIPLADLTSSFPREQKDLSLAYEQSKSLIEYIQRKYGTDAILNILGHLKDRNPVDVAIQKSISVSIEELESKWHNSLGDKYTWLIYVSNHIYWILFLIAALLTILGFIRLSIKKRNYVDVDDL